MTRSSAILLAALVFAAPRPCAAQTIVFDLDALGSFPVGNDTGIRSASDDLDAGYGARVDALYSLRPWLSVGLGLGVISNRTELIPASFLPGASSSVKVRGRLTSVPVHAVVQAQSESDGGLGFFGAAGAGITDFSLRVDDVAQSGDLSQTDFSFKLGAGLTYAFTETWSGRLGLEYLKAFTGHGEVWLEGNDPQALLVTLGVQFARSGDEVGP